MAVNAATLDLIKHSEGWVDHAYPDPGTGGEPLTIGYGHTSAAGPPRVTAGMTISPAEGETILQADLAKSEADVARLVKVPLNDNQRGALVSFDFNIGVGSFATSTLLRKLNAGDYAGAADEFLRWDHAAGKILPGLTVRRQAERALFLSKPTGAPPAPPEAPQTPSNPSFLQALVDAILDLIKGFRK